MPGLGAGVARRAAVDHGGVVAPRPHSSRPARSTGSRPPCSARRIGDEFDATVLAVRNGTVTRAARRPCGRAPRRRAAMACAPGDRVRLRLDRRGHRDRARRVRTRRPDALNDAASTGDPRDVEQPASVRADGDRRARRTVVSPISAARRLASAISVCDDLGLRHGLDDLALDEDLALAVAATRRRGRPRGPRPGR